MAQPVIASLGAGPSSVVSSSARVAGRQRAPVRVSGELKGVVGVDLLLNDLLDDVAQYASTTADSYAFVADSQGRVLVHPNLPAPTDWAGPPIFLHVDELER